MTGEQYGARRVWIEESGDVGDEGHEMTVDRKRLALGAMAPGRRIEHHTGKPPAAAEAPLHVGDGVIFGGY